MLKNRKKREGDLLKVLLNEYCKGYDKFTTKERKIILNCFYLTNLTFDAILEYHKNYEEEKLNVKTT